MKLKAELEATGGNTTGFRVPDEFVAELGGGGRPKIVAVVNGYRWRTSIARMGGEYWLGVSAANRTGAGVTAGEVLEVEVALDTAAREVEVPADLARARERTGLDEAVLTGTGQLRGRQVAVVVSEFGFLAGSIGVAAGELLLRPAREMILREALAPAGQEVRLALAELGKDAGLIGAALIGLEALAG